MEAFQEREDFKISKAEALKHVLNLDIRNLKVDLTYQFTMAETAIEILGCMRLVEKIAPKVCPECGSTVLKAFCTNCGHKF